MKMRFGYLEERRKKMATKPKIYLAGKITGLPVEDYTANFNYWKGHFQKLGFKVISPIDLPHKHADMWQEYMKEDIAAMVKCKYLFAMVGWQNSKGAKIEVELARALKINIYYQEFIAANT